jgi:hypothetical protein
MEKSQSEWIIQKQAEATEKKYGPILKKKWSKPKTGKVIFYTLHSLF